MNLFALTLASFSLLASAPVLADSTRLREDVRAVAPALEKYALGTLLGEVWKRPGLSLRDRSIVTLAALITRNQTVEMADYLDLALDNVSLGLPAQYNNETPSVLCNAQDSDSLAGFVDLTFDVTDKFQVGGGYRYTEDKKSWEGRTQDFLSSV